MPAFEVTLSEFAVCPDCKVPPLYHWYLTSPEALVAETLRITVVLSLAYVVAGKVLDIVGEGAGVSVVAETSEDALLEDILVASAELAVRVTQYCLESRIAEQVEGKIV